MRGKVLLRVYVLLAILSGVSLTLIDILPLSTLGLEVKYYILNSIRGGFISLLSLFIFLYFKYSIGSSQWEKFTDFLWNVVATGLLTILLNIFIILLEKQLGQGYIADKRTIINFLNHIQLVLVLVFVSKGFFVWKKMILYQKTKRRLYIWNIFEALIYVSLFFTVWEHKYNTFSIIFLSISFILGFLLSINVKWVAFLNFQQKWQSILFISLILAISSVFLSQILNDLKNPFIIINLSANIFLLLIFGFLIIYSVISFLVLLFNLPTSSVFEQKFEESLNFQKISQAIDINKSESDIYAILLESSMKTVMADNGWVECFSEKETKIIPEFITADTVMSANDNLKNYITSKNDKSVLINQLSEKITEQFTGIKYHSAIVIPVYVSDKKEAQMVLLKDVKDGFDKEMLSIIDSYAIQTGISIENLRLLKNAVENERYKEDLAIAKDVKTRLLPKKTIQHPDFDFYAYSQSADDVGGDYYDAVAFLDNKFAVVIADVSGHGISAAFNMAQLKGALNAILCLHIPIKQIFKLLNKAISDSIEKTSFISMSYFEFDLEKKLIHYYQGGHCPALYYNSETNTTEYIKDYGVALGILRNDKYADIVNTKSITIKKGDILLLYTDGIVEAKNKTKEELGYETLKIIFEKKKHLNAQEIVFSLKKELELFTSAQNLEDDMTLICVKF
jgi:phosphoserine phosphatase RsbU/P